MPDRKHAGNATGQAAAGVGAGAEAIALAEPQPYLHGHLTCVRAPVIWISLPSGDLADGVDGLYVADRRALSQLRIEVAGEPPVPITGCLLTADDAQFVAIVRGLDDLQPDPRVVCERHRRLCIDGGAETIRLENHCRTPITTVVELWADTDLAAIGEVKSGRSTPLLAAEALPGGLGWRACDGTRARLSVSPEPEVDTADGRLRWQVHLPAGGAWTAELTIRLSKPDDIASDVASDVNSGVAVGTTGTRGRKPPPFRPTPPLRPAPWQPDPLRLRADDRRADELLRRSVADLDGLRLCDPLQPADEYFAAGSPWYLTLFGRDALWAAQLALPLGPDVLLGTLRTLARRQGAVADAERDEAPGKILHEVRPTDAAVSLPPVYYGTVDATPLFVTAATQAWRWGAPAADIAALLPAVQRALHWMREHADPDQDGLIEYDPNGSGLVNQGWKDSTDGVQWADGQLAETPLALSEVQAYAYRAALDGASLLDEFGLPGSAQWRAWAQRLARRFRRTFWLEDADGPYPAIALDAHKCPVDAPASNMGHLLGTGLLNPEEENLVARRLRSPSLDSGYGLRTLSDTAQGFNPLSYHAGSVWPHDTTIAARGLIRAGHPDTAARLIRGIIAAAATFGYRLPELYSGHAAHPSAPPIPYPASCRPQAWAAAVGPALVSILLGLQPDIPAGLIRLRPIAPSPIGAFEVHRIRVGTGALAVRVEADGSAHILSAPAGLRWT